MRRALSVVALMALITGCSKSAGPSTDDKPAAKVEPHAESSQPPPKVQEPPQLVPVQRFKTGIREVARVAVTDDGTQVAVGSDAGGKQERIEIWNLKPEAKRVREMPGFLRALSPDGKLLVRSGKGWNQVDVIDATTGELACEIREESNFQAFTAPDKLVTVHIVDNLPDRPGSLRLRKYDARTGRAEGEFSTPCPSQPTIQGPVNGRREVYFVWAATGRIEVWDLGSGRMVRDVTTQNARPKNGLSNFVVSPDGKRMTAQWGMDQPVGVYDTGTGAEVATTGHQTASTFVPGRDLILGHTTWSGGGHKTYSGWRAHDLTKKAVVADLPGAYLLPAVSADGRVMVSMVERATPELLVWDLTGIP